MTTTDQIEAVARAIASGAGLKWDSLPHSNYDGAVIGQVTRLGLHNAAKAAIAAMLTPTEGMIKAGESAQAHTSDCDFIFYEMVQAALGNRP